MLRPSIKECVPFEKFGIRNDPGQAAIPLCGEQQMAGGGRARVPGIVGSLSIEGTDYEPK